MAEDYLKKLLNPGLQSKLDSIKSAASEIWKAPKLQHFTKHGIGHSENIIKILNLILGDMSTMKNKLSLHEIFILLASTYLHDSGMQSAHHAGLPDKEQYSINDMNIIRDRHHETSSKMILESIGPNADRRINCGLADCTQPNYVRYIALLSKSHRMNKPEISSNLLKDDYLKTGEKIRVRLLVSLLRLADELDRDYMRVNMDELKLWNIPIDSKVYWWMHHYTKAVPIENGRIKILFRIPIYYKNSQRKLDEIIFRKVIDSVGKQVSEVKNVLWRESIYLDFEQGDPKTDDNNYCDEPALLTMPDDVIDYATEKLTQKSGNELAIRTGAIYWLDGIPQSDDKDLRERAFRFMTFMEEERYNDAIADLEETLKVYILSPTQKMSILLNLGNAYYSLSQFDNALKNYNASLELAKKVSERDAIEGKASALGNIGLIYFDKGDLDNALKYLKDALKIDQEIGSKKGEASGLGNIGLIYRVKGDLDNALKYLKDALKIHREIGSKKGEASGLVNIGLIYSNKGDLDNALKHLKDALKIDQEIGYKQGEASALGNIGLIYFSKGDLDNTLKYLNDALKIHREIGYKQGEASALGNIGLIYRVKGDLDNALEHLNDALEIHREIGYKQGEASGLGNIGLIYRVKGDLDNALEHLNDALEIHREISYKQGEASALGNIGLIYFDKGDLDNALKYHRDALKIDQEIGYKQGEASALDNIGLIYSDKVDLDNALKYHQDALEIYREIGYKQGEASALGNIGLIYSDKGDLDNALKYHRDALKIDQEIGYKQEEANQLGNIGLIYSDKVDLDNALKYHRDALEIHREIGYKQGEASALGNIGLIYSDKGDLDNALKYLKDAKNILHKHNLIYGRDIIQNAIDLITKGIRKKD